MKFKNLKNNKASGCDNIVNEHIKHTIFIKIKVMCLSQARTDQLH